MSGALALMIALTLSAEPTPVAPAPAAPAEPTPAAPTPAAPAEPTSAEPTSAEPTSAEPTPTSQSTSIRVRVTYLHPSGAVLPGGGAALRIERSRMPRPGEMADPEIVQAWSAIATPDGAARFDDLPPLGTAESDSVVATWMGAETRTPLTAPNDGRIEPLSVIVRALTRNVSRLEMLLRLTLTPRDTGMQIDHLIRIENPTHEAIDTDQGAGLVLPLVTPAPFGEPVPSFLPQRPEPREFLTQQQPDQGRVLVERGRLVFRGIIPPDGQLVRVVYLVPYADENEHTYGLRMPLPARAVSLIVRSPERVLPGVAFRAPSEALVRGFMGGEERTLLLRDPPAAGEVVLIDVRGTPDRHSFFRPVAAGLGALLVGTLIVLAVGRKRRSELGASAASDHG